MQPNKDIPRNSLPVRSFVIRDGEIYFESKGCGCCAQDDRHSKAEALETLEMLEGVLRQWREDVEAFDDGSESHP